MKKAQNNTKNYTIERANYKERFEIITNYHLLDERLTLAEKGFLTCLLILPNQWKITTRATAKYFNIDKSTFMRHIKKLVEIGYIEVKKGKANQTTYIIKEKPIKADFDIKNINNYTIQQLNTFLNDSRIEERYKNLIKKALGIATETSEHFNKLIEEIEESTKTENDKIELPF